tara:strand:+ start:1939 stop:2172 length:234 start_codon:yes stop_codon:yes gene_type:complete
MDYLIKLDEEQLMALIEMIEKNRCEGEEEVCSQVRTSIKSQFQSQYKEKEQIVSVDSEDVLERAKQTMGPNYCDNCD